MENRIWKDVVGYEGLYKVSDDGNIYSARRKGTRGGVLKCGDIKEYYRVSLHRDGERNIELVHRVVAIAFIPNDNNFPQINHKNGNKKDNRVSNLEWSSSRENILHAYRNKLHPGQRGELNGNAKLTIKEVDEIRKLYNEGHLQKSIAKAYGVTQVTVSDVITHKRWYYQ
jgi:hypothetical protein